jgi:hypothetical protein
MPNIRKPLFVVPYDLGTITTGNAASGYPATSLNRQRETGLVWKTSGASNVWVRCNLGSAKAIDFISLVGTNALPGTTIRVRLGASQAEVDGTAPYDSGALPLIPVVSTGGAAIMLDFVNNTYVTDGTGILASNGFCHSHLELPSTVNAQWVRIDIGSHTGDFQASSLVLGEVIEPARFYDTDFEYGAIPLGSIDFTRNGVIDEKPGSYHRSLKFSMSWVNETEYEDGFRPLIERAAGSPLFLCFDPEPTIYRNRKTYLGFLNRPPFTRGVLKPGYFNQEWEMRSVI